MTEKLLSSANKCYKTCILNFEKPKIMTKLIFLHLHYVALTLTNRKKHSKSGCYVKVKKRNFSNVLKSLTKIQQEQFLKNLTTRPIKFTMIK